MTFGTLALLVAAGLAGPLLGARGRIFVPAVIGEILAGVVLGPSAVDAFDPTDPTVVFLSGIGFAMLMFTVGAHVPVRDPRLPTSLRRGAVSAVVLMLLAPLGGLLAALIAGTGHAAIYAVLLASGSVAAVLGMLDEAGLQSPAALTVMGQVTITDVATMLAVPLVLQPSRAGTALLGGVLVAGAAALVFVLARAVDRWPGVDEVRRRSEHRRWALDLRLSLLVLFALAWLAQRSGTSVLIAGFSAGLLIAALRGPERLSTQVQGVADGFFVPLFFVVLGAQLPVDALVREPSMLRLTLALLVVGVVLHLIAAAAGRQGAPAALTASAQLGVPAAVVALGLRESVLRPAEGAAIIVAALGSLAVAAAGTALLVRAQAARGDPPPVGPADAPTWPRSGT